MRLVTIGLLMTAMTLSGCNGQESAMTGPGSKAKGRYAGIGTFAAGALWREMAGAPDPAVPAMAKLEDDEQIIVVIDGQTGEVRQCGNHSGFCVTMNPWTAAGPRAGTPVKLKKHASDLEAENQPDAETAENAVDTAPAR